MVGSAPKRSKPPLAISHLRMAIAQATPRRLRDLQTLNRATEVYLMQLMPVSEIALHIDSRRAKCVREDQRTRK